MHLIDTHAHLNDDAFRADLPQVIDRAHEQGVIRIIVCGYDLDSSRAAVQMAQEYESVFATVGIHPHDARSYGPDVELQLAELSRAPKVLAIGEIGLDFHYDFSPRDAQASALDAQLRLAATLQLPVVIHSRESNPEVLDAVSRHASQIKGGVFHCFSGDEAFAERVLELGFYIGVDGPLTYKKSEALRSVVRMCPMERLLVETDCPYLTPVPYRGKRNEPSYVRFVAEEVARIKETTLENVASATTKNACLLFGGALRLETEDEKADKSIPPDGDI